MSFKLNEMGEVSFHLIGTNGFYVNADNEKFAAEGYVRTSYLKISQRASARTIFPASKTD